MCGICGFAGPGGPQTITAMNRAQKHRGPDATGVWSDAEHGVFLGHQRLSIIDITGGSQPMVSGHGTIAITFNGEIYNHEELRKELEGLGHTFSSSHCDTEVLMHGYQQWGPGVVDRLNGMWAFALYDIGRKTLFLSRDRFGKKPLFYFASHNVFAFASELTALCQHPRVEACVCAMSLKKYFAYGYIPAPGTLYQDIRKLPGGHNLLYNVLSGQHEIQCYWRFEIDPFEHLPRNAEEQWGEEIRDLLEKAVRRRLMADVPLGVFLSGGIDSSAVAFFAARHATGHNLKSFSIGFDDPSFDETSFAKQAAHFVGSDHQSTLLSADAALTILPQIVGLLDEPMGDSSLLPTFLLCKETRKQVTVALGGDGADELFAGYDPFVALRFAQWYTRLVPRPMHTAIGLLAARLPTALTNMSIDFKIKRTLRGLSYPPKLWNSVWLGPCSPADIADLFAQPTDIHEVYAEAIEAWDACAQPSIVDKTLAFYTNLYLQNDILVKIDRAGMMNSLEVRSPFLDIDLVNLVRRIPWQYKLRHGRTKHILKKALKPLLPASILGRKKKGFGVPVGSWFSQGLLDLPRCTFSGMLDQKAINSRFTAHRSHRADHRGFLWNQWLLGTMILNRYQQRLP